LYLLPPLSDLAVLAQTLPSLLDPPPLQPTDPATTTTTPRCVAGIGRPNVLARRLRLKAASRPSILIRLGGNSTADHGRPWRSAAARTSRLLVMRIVGTVPSWPPTWVDELSSLLSDVGRTPPGRADRVDTTYQLTTALAEIEAWLSVMPNDKQPAGDRASMLADVSTAFAQRGPEVQLQTPAAAALITELRQFGSSSQAAMNQLRQSVAATRAELSQPAVVAAAFDDLVEAVKSLTTAPATITARLGVVVCLLQLNDRPASQVCRLVGDIVCDGAFEIEIARHELYGTPIERHARPDALAGLSIDDRLDLCRLYLQHLEQRGHHVVWLVYQDARLDPGPEWRRKVGPVEFFDGPTMLRAVEEPDEVFQTGPLPNELVEPRVEGGLNHSPLWPTSEDLRWWIAARVDLGPGQFSDPVRVAREQADVVVQLAIFRRRSDSTWRPTDGYIHVVDGHERGSRGPFVLRDEFQIEYDHTADELAPLAASIGPRLPVNNPTLRRILGGVSTLNVAAKASSPDLLTHSVRVVELIRQECEFPSWSDFVSACCAVTGTYNEILRQIWEAVHNVLGDHDMKVMRVIPNTDELHARLRYYRGGGLVADRGAALQILTELTGILPDHNTNARQLRHLAHRAQDVVQLRQWLADLNAEFVVKLNRVVRFRNGLTHGGTAEEDVARTIRNFFAEHTRFLARQALQAAIENRSVKDEFADLRKNNRAWRARITKAPSVHDALFAVL
jgi:hypothetical protein